ncbi:MAG: Mrp/NBP35 family ATP-binding protein [Candidatus Omnitrophica bacterium]|nr:Mrp/NBP35 family ATP-binding protein [Candidatus Omnitrophota bacterium]
MKISEQAVVDALRTVEDPDLRRDLVSLGLVKDLKIEGDKVSLTIELTTPACPLKEKIKKDTEDALRAVPGVARVEIGMTAKVRSSLSGGQERFAGIRNIVAVASGKGGVGKSTLSVNLAVALARTGARVGLMDADIYGPNIPLMVGLSAKPKTDGKKIIPPENYGIKVISMGFLVPEDQAVIWRGPMLHGAIQQFLGDVAWGELDYLLVDLPPGTGDVQLSLSQTVPMTGALMVTTPQAVSLQDVRKGIAMFQKVRVPILGLVENMSYFICPHCSDRTEIFSHGGGKRAAESLGIPFLGELPLDPAVREGGDAGKPVVAADPASPVAVKFLEIAESLAQQISIIHYSRPDFSALSI